MAAVTVGCHTNNPLGRCHCLLSYQLSFKNVFICHKKDSFVVKRKEKNNCMRTDSDGCHVDYLYNN